MPSNETTQRQFARAEDILTRAAATPSTEQVALKAIGPDMLGECRAYKVADAAVKAAERGAAKEVREAIEALSPLRKFYDQTREVVMAKLPGGTWFAGSTSFTTPDDFLAACEDVEDALEPHKDTDWAKGLYEKLATMLDGAAKEHGEAGSALAALQRAKAERRSIAMRARPVFVRFRRVVRGTFGRPSREYRSLLDRRGIAADDDVETPPPTP
jgi:hypothetical protein